MASKRVNGSLKEKDQKGMGTVKAKNGYRNQRLGEKAAEQFQADSGLGIHLCH